jgi:hypothetical protein
VLAGRTANEQEKHRGNSGEKTMKLWSRSQNIAVDRAASTRTLMETSEARPCFFHRDCGGMAEIEKQGKAVCRVCAKAMKGIEYPLRQPSREPLYPVPADLVKQLGMGMGKTKRVRT